MRAPQVIIQPTLGKPSNTNFIRGVSPIFLLGNLTASRHLSSHEKTLFSHWIIQYIQSGLGELTMKPSLVGGPGEKPLWKIWVHQLGWWQQPNMNGKHNPNGNHSPPTRSSLNLIELVNCWLRHDIRGFYKFGASPLSLAGWFMMENPIYGWFWSNYPYFSKPPYITIMTIYISVIVVLMTIIIIVFLRLLSLLSWF